MSAVRRLTRPSQQRTATGDQFPEPEGLDQIVIGANLQTENPIGFAVSRADHEDWGRVVGATQFSAKIKAPHAWEHQVQDDEINIVNSCLEQKLKSLGPISTGEHLIALGPEGITDGLANRFVILDHEEPSSSDCCGDRGQSGPSADGSYLPTSSRPFD